MNLANYYLSIFIFFNKKVYFEILFYLFLLAFIEKNTWSGLEDFYSNLAEALHVEISATKSKSGKSRRKIKKNNKSVRFILLLLLFSKNMYIIRFRDMFIITENLFRISKPYYPCLPYLLCQHRFLKSA